MPIFHQNESLNYIPMKANVLSAINVQMQAEFQSSYTYLAYAAHLDGMNLKGFAHWMRLQFQEEQMHALKLYDHILRRGGEVNLMQLDQPVVTGDNPLDIFEHTLKHEQMITTKIHELYKLALEEADYPLQTLLHWFIDEQVEEEENVNEILDKLRLIGDNGPNLFLLDQELGSRKAEAEEA